MTLEDEASSQSSGEDEDEEEEGEDEANEEEGVGKGLSSNSKSVSQEPPRVKSETPALGSDASQVLQLLHTAEERACLTQYFSFPMFRSAYYPAVSCCCC